ncbi:uncharacterized protein A4U43_C07F34570 [Asparagus officinalis]|uniref:Uncharacterized protein n=1 Tax=Asparagus officinalis TaxID=4686 RepID=A0A5P1EH10_ASPOF|nr:uncharacterized protein A4U43_C07F34570 [Asparagus officinalis]
MGGQADGGTVKRRGCGKADFLPEESFQSWSNYARALKQTGPRLLDRVTARSMDETELNEVKARSGHEMKKSLSWWDLIWFGIGAVIGAGIFVRSWCPASRRCSLFFATRSSLWRSQLQIHLRNLSAGMRQPPLWNDIDPYFTIQYMNFGFIAEGLDVYGNTSTTND